MTKAELFQDGRELNFGDLSCLRNDMWSAKEILVVKVVRAPSRYRRTVHGKDVMSGLFVFVVRLEFLVFGMIEADLFFD